MTWTPFSAGCFVLQRMTCTIHAAQCIMASAAPSLTLWMRRPGVRPLVLCQKKKRKKSELCPPRRMTLLLEAACIEEGQPWVWISSITMQREEGCTYYWQEKKCLHLNDLPATLPLCLCVFICFSPPVQLALQTKHKCCHETMKVQLLLLYQIFIPFSLECSYMPALHEIFWINQQSALKCKCESWCLRFLVASFLKSSLQWEYFEKLIRSKIGSTRFLSFFFFL